MHEPKKKPSSRVPEIDLLRFFAASAVVVYHYTYRPMVHGVADPQLFGATQDISRYGYLGVNLFFMISGFVILWSSQGRSAHEFVISRIARLYPSFWVCMLLTALIVNVVGADPIPAKTIVANLTMLPSLVHVPYVDGVYWTLLVEIKFYVLVFLVLVTGSMKHVQALLGLWLAGNVICATGFAPGALASLVMYPYGPLFISGGVFYLMRARGATPYLTALAVVSCLLAVRHGVTQQPGFTQDITTLTSVVSGLAILAFHIAFAFIALRPGLIAASRWSYILGTLTYPLYLVHARIGKTLWALLVDHVPLGVALACLFVVAYSLASVVAAITERRVCAALHRALTGYAARVPFLSSAP